MPVVIFTPKIPEWNGSSQSCHCCWLWPYLARLPTPCRPPKSRSFAPRDEALRRAQRELRQSEDHSSPYFWAAFTLTGQWR